MAIPLALKLGAALAGLTGAGAGITRSVPELVFGDVQQQAANERGSYDERLGEEGGRRKDLGDHLRGLFSGQEDQVDKAVQERYIEDLEDEASKRGLNRMKSVLGDEFQGNLQIKGNTRKRDLDRLVEANQRQYNRRIDLLDKADLLGRGEEAEGMTSSQISNMLREAQSKEKKDLREEGYRRQDLRDNRALELQLLNQQFERENAMRESRYQNRVLDMQDRQNARNARRDQLLMLMKGLQAYQEAMNL